LIDDGKDDPNAVKRLAEYQHQAATLGIPVSLAFHEHMRRNAWAHSIRRERILPLLTFVFGT
jgi:hypothetical protein